MTENKILFFVAQTTLDLIFFIGVFLNMSVIFVLFFSRTTTKQRSNRSYMMHFSIANLCFLLGVPLFVIRLRFESFWPASMVVCRLDNGLYSVIPFTIGAFLAILSVNQYLEVCKPNTAKRLKASGTFDTISVLTWCISGILMTPLFLYTGMQVSGDSVRCIVEWPDIGSLGGENASVLYRFLIGFALPVPVCIVFNVVTIRYLQKNSEESRVYNWDDTKLMLVFLVAYIVSWWPHWVYHLIYLSESIKMSMPTHMMVTMWIVSECMIYTNSALCPLLYAYVSDDFKRSFLEACVCCCKSRLKKQTEEENDLNMVSSHYNISQRDSSDLKSSLETSSRDQLSQTENYTDVGVGWTQAPSYQNGSLIGQTDSITQTMTQEYASSETQTATSENKNECTETEL